MIDFKYCVRCGEQLNKDAVVCTKCGCYADGHEPKQKANTNNNKWIALLLWFFLGGFGAHHFYTHNNAKGVAYLLVTCLGWILLGLPYIALVVLEIIDLIHILQGELNGVQLEG